MLLLLLWTNPVNPVLYCVPPGLTLKHSTFCSQNVLVRSVHRMYLYVLYGSRKRVNILLCSFFVGWLVFITESGWVSCAVRAESLNKLHINYSLWILWLWSGTRYVCTYSVDLRFVHWVWIYPKFGFEVSSCIFLLEYCTFDCTAFEMSGISDLTTLRHSPKEINFQKTLWKPRVLKIMSVRNQGMSRMFKQSNFVFPSVQKSN
jgi:hypothetical protein